MTNVVDFCTVVLTLEHHVRAADRVGLGVELLAEDRQLPDRVEVAQVLLGDAASCPAGRVVDGLDDPLVLSCVPSPANSRSTIKRMISRGVKWWPAVSFDCSLKRLISSSKT